MASGDLDTDLSEKMTEVTSNGTLTRHRMPLTASLYISLGFPDRRGGVEINPPPAAARPARRPAMAQVNFGLRLFVWDCVHRVDVIRTNLTDSCILCVGILLS